MRDDEKALLHELAVDFGIEPAQVAVERTSIQAQGRRVSALRWGPRPSRLVLLHGGGANAHAWDKVLLQRPLDALAVDLPGHGDSDWSSDPSYLPEDLADALAPVLRGSDDGRPVTVAGHSLGGLTALALAARHPALVRRLVLVDASPEPRPEVGVRAREATAVPAFASFEALVESVVEPGRAAGPGLRRALRLNSRELPDGRYRWRHDTRETSERDRWTRLFAAVGRGWEHAARVACPVLLLHGAVSRVLTDDDVLRYRRVVPGLQVEVLDGAGHDLPGSRASEVGRHLQREVEAAAC